MSNGGVIVNLTSTAGFKASAGISAYVASKHAVVGITKALALDFGPSASVCSPSPRRSSTRRRARTDAPLKDAGVDIEAQRRRQPTRADGRTRRRGASCCSAAPIWRHS